MFYAGGMKTRDSQIYVQIKTADGEVLTVRGDLSALDDVWRRMVAVQQEHYAARREQGQTAPAGETLHESND